MSATYSRTDRTRLKRKPDRGSHEREAVHALLDDALIAHVGYVIDGTPFVTPTAFWREGDLVYWHGAAAARMLKHQREPVEVCFTVSRLDALVLSRAAFHHSMNYRSVMAFGTCEFIDDPEEKRRQLELFLDRVVPGRSREVRPPTRRELRLTSVIALRLEECVLKSRTGPVGDDGEDLEAPVWAGLLPVNTVMGALQPDAGLPASAPAPREYFQFRCP
jgi:nitroimidazol reductase NimA-like FMN-containing flavoprotein (pyridoxamine 5'-phosphate oxidase superfamily)